MIKIFFDKQSQQPWCVERQQELVKFYDCRYELTPLGQFVSSYNLYTLLAHEQGTGLNLDGGIPSWRIYDKCMDRIVNWLLLVTQEEEED